MKLSHLFCPPCMQNRLDVIHSFAYRREFQHQPQVLQVLQILQNCDDCVHLNTPHLDQRLLFISESPSHHNKPGYLPPGDHRQKQIKQVTVLSEEVYCVQNVHLLQSKCIYA